MTTTGAVETRRDRKRRSTHEALLEAALDLFEERGFAATTIEDITERADVARRTFFRHFPSKEAVLFPDPTDYEQRLAAALDEQPTPLTMSRVLDAFVAAAALQADEPHHRRRAAIVTSSELQLAGTAWQAFVKTRDTVAAKLADRTGLPVDDRRVQMAASIGLFAISQAYVAWAESDGAGDLAAHVADAVTTLKALISDELPLT
ncbi:MAG TPA: TetR family transcriptional regulator [Acidimicrobiales bacterium]|nr:TetR family transcriptional regulator [Acidimicrobiales bacterium]